MKINRKLLRKMIITEIKNMQEARGDHLRGVKKKIPNLESELAREKAFYQKQIGKHPMYGGPSVDSIADMSRYDDILYDIDSSKIRKAKIENKIEVLKQQLAALEALEAK